MTRKKTKQLCAVLLAVVMTMAMLPLTVFATESPVVVKDANGNQIGYDNLTLAFEEAPDGATVYLNEDVQMSFLNKGTPQQKSPTVKVENKTIILDGQNHTVFANSQEAFSMFEVRAGGKLTIKNVTLDGGASDTRCYSNILLIEGWRSNHRRRRNTNQ